MPARTCLCSRIPPSKSSLVSKVWRHCFLIGFRRVILLGPFLYNLRSLVAFKRCTKLNFVSQKVYLSEEVTGNVSKGRPVKVCRDLLSTNFGATCFASVRAFQKRKKEKNIAWMHRGVEGSGGCCLHNCVSLAACAQICLHLVHRTGANVCLTRCSYPCALAHAANESIFGVNSGILNGFVMESSYTKMSAPGHSQDCPCLA